MQNKLIALLCLLALSSALSPNFFHLEDAIQNATNVTNSTNCTETAENATFDIIELQCSFACLDEIKQNWKN